MPLDRTRGRNRKVSVTSLKSRVTDTVKVAAAFQSGAWGLVCVNSRELGHLVVTLSLATSWWPSEVGHLGHLRDLFVPQCPLYKMKIIIASTSQGCCED